MESDVVVFRRWRDSGDIVALFPEVPADIFGDFCEAYEYVGQHGGADYHGVIQATTPVEPVNATILAEELERIGYCLRPIMRASPHHHDKRRRSARSIADTV
jgi:hypothetical protein